MELIKKFLPGGIQEKVQAVKGFVPFDIKDKIRQVKEFIEDVKPILAKACAIFGIVMSAFAAITAVLSFVAYFKLRKK